MSRMSELPYKIFGSIYEQSKEVAEYLGSILDPGFQGRPMVVLDIGAHLGALPIAMRRSGVWSSDVTYFGWEPQVADQCHANLSHMGLLSERSRVFSKAVSPENPVKLLFLTEKPYWGCGSRFLDETKHVDGELREYEAVNLSFVLEQLPKNLRDLDATLLLKVDIEGGEYLWSWSEWSAFFGALEAQAPRQLIIDFETHGQQADYSGTLERAHPYWRGMNVWSDVRKVMSFELQKRSRTGHHRAFGPDQERYIIDAYHREDPDGRQEVLDELD